MRAARHVPLLLALLLAAGCTRLGHLGTPPDLTPVADEDAEVRRLTTEEVVRRFPVPPPVPPVPRQPGSLWQAGSQGFFDDYRASRVGDIVTVLIDINEAASFTNETRRSRDAEESLGTPNLFGLESLYQRVLPNAVDPDSLVSINSGTATTGRGTSRRSEKVQVRMAAVIAAILPNGNFVINGSQEVRVNYDLREVQIAGVVRPQDVSSDNTVTYDKIAEARIAYGGRGQLFDMQQPRYGQQVLDIILPF